MFYITGNNIEMTRGDTLHAVINMRDPLGVISYPETGDVVTFNAMLTRDGEAVITKTIPHDTMTLTLDPEDTEELAYGRYIFTVKITRANGDVDTFIDGGTLTLVKTWRHKPHDAYVPWSPWIPLNSMNGWLAPGGAAPVDAALNISSTHPVQNRVLYQALAGKVDKVEGMGLSHNDFTDALAQKLADIEAGATKVTVDALFVAGSTNPVQSKTIQAALAAKVDKEVGKGLSSNDYTSAEKEKLSGIEAGAQKNPDMSGYALKSEIHSVPSGGRAGQVLGKASSDSYDLEWVDQTGGGGGGAVNDVTLDGESVVEDGVAVLTSPEIHNVPSGGTTGQYLKKLSDDDYDADWGDPPVVDEPVVFITGTLNTSTNVVTVSRLPDTAQSLAMDAAFKIVVLKVGVRRYYLENVTGNALSGPFYFHFFALDNYVTTEVVSFSSISSAATSMTGQLMTATIPTSKSDLGLGNVDNTSDAAKPISTATQTALDGKITAPSSPTAGQFLVYNGTAWVAQTVPNASGVSF